MQSEFLLATYTSLLLLHNLYLYEERSGSFLGYLCTIVSPDQGILRKVRMLLLVTLRRANVSARLSHDNLPITLLDLPLFTPYPSP